MRKFRLLTADEIECRIAQVKPNGIQLLLYKTARTDAALLDETYPDAWQCDFKALDGKMYCGIGIKINNEWLWRWDCGAESNMEAEKGEASDAFKRAGFKWGLGTELYSSPFIWIKPDACKIENGKCSDRFKVMNIEYDKNERICALDIDNLTQHKSAFHMGKAVKTEDFAELALARQQIYALFDNDVEKANAYVADLTHGMYRKVDDMSLEHLKLAKVRYAQRASK